MYFALVGTRLSNDLEEFENVGMVFRDVEDGEEGIMEVFLPKGWTTCEGETEGEHYILDTYGRRRAVYHDNLDAKYHLELLCRYQYFYEVEAENKVNPADNIVRLVVRDCDGKKVYISSTFKVSDREDHGIEISNLFSFMDKYYPYWRNPSCYWTF